MIFKSYNELTPAQRQALQETRNVLPGMKAKIEAAMAKLEDELVSAGSCPSGPYY